ncbi:MULTISPECIES: hypothetical protein [Halocynthiibacter]|uniref:Uncharacterized protein n=1 Tax=Halocynthiibacter halioticoli TaxID=2986804 RepID=A0AAE3IZ00_9RHOB|nr:MULTISPECIES: hypothetical protein [Halocynthiibacter]MCV6824314.1 hypothetical protein [Halocynthiibacter halioticoli]MCW4057315.1 hypothetical protein [Halocynthiibacter sp. SDUM655004]MDE0589647.1 hypothetical protein [Halocynthiibacter sp. C4]
MQTLTAGYRGLSLLVGLNLDRIIALGVIAGSLAVGAYFAS